MRTVRHLLLLAFGFLLVLESAAQKKGQSGMRKTKTAYYYSFTGATSLADVQRLSDSIYAMTSVTEFKARFKQENGMGEIMVVATEKLAGSESRPQFDAIHVKKLVADYGFTFAHLTLRDMTP